MCYAFYLFTDKEVEEKPFDTEHRGMYIRRLVQREQVVSEWVSGIKNIYYVGSSQGCGCGWAKAEEWDEDAEKQERQKDRDSLYCFLEEQHLEGSYLIICWEGDQGEALEREEKLYIEQVRDIYFEFEECVKYIVTTQI